MLCWGEEWTEDQETSSYASIALVGYSWTKLNSYLVYNMEEITWIDLSVKSCMESF